jgi:hypothetical protein
MKTTFLAALLGICAAAAQASTITLSSGAQCTYTAIAIGATGDVSVGCLGSAPPPQPPGPTPTPTPTPVPPPSGCPGATITDAFTADNQKHVYNLARGQTAAVAFTPQAGQRLQLSTTDTTGTPDDATHTIAIAECPGEMVRPWPCSGTGSFVGTTIRAVAGVGPMYECRVEPGRTYYMNVRMESCAMGACPIRVQIQGYQ